MECIYGALLILDMSRSARMGSFSALADFPKNDKRYLSHSCWLIPTKLFLNVLSGASPDITVRDFENFIFEEILYGENVNLLIIKTQYAI